MTYLKDTLKSADPGLMREAVLTGNPARVPDEKGLDLHVGQYPALRMVLPALSERLDANPNISMEERRAFMLGALTCLEAIADYAEIEQIKARASGE
jgi:hypothetical protein